MNVQSVLRCLLCLCCIGAINTVQAGEDRLVLVAPEGQKVQPLNKTELRRLFLGLPVYRKGVLLQPLINKSEDFCYQVFLQSIVGMSQKRYERTLVSSLYRQGINSPPVYTDVDKILEEMTKSSSRVSFMFIHDGTELTGKSLEIVQEIWASGKN